MNEKIVLALGGNALQKPGADTFEEQLQNIEESSQQLLNLLVNGYDVVITHGNGPQVGRILLQNELASHETPAMPLDVCGAMSQGMIGYGIQIALRKILENAGVKREILSIITQVVVDKDDPALLVPTKPVGKYFTSKEAKKLQEERGYVVKKDAHRGYRRVVSSPHPVSIVELDVIKSLMEKGIIVITVGGGGIPVVKDAGGGFRGIEAVIDKDLASERLAQDIGAQIFLILTPVDNVYLNFQKENETKLTFVGVDELKKYRDEGHFSPGSMLPKINAAIAFVESGLGRKAIITSLNKGVEAVQGKAGTIIS